jgi:CHAD domain-containing protein
MAYRFRSAETVQTSVRRCLAEQAEHAISALRSGVDSDPVDAIHDVRKSIKKERSLLRLARTGLTGPDRRHENDLLRSLAHELGASRESDALVSAFEGLTETFADRVSAATLELVGERLRAEQNLARSALTDAAVPSRVADEIERHLDRVRTLSVDRGG